MEAGTTMHAPGAALAPEDQDRADLYALVAALLLERPEPALLAALGEAPALPDSPLAAPWARLSEAARRSAASAATEFDALFVATGTPLLNPYQCYYLVGCLMDRPLAVLRSDLQALGLARSEDSRELEDHLGALCESMRLLVVRGAALEAQRGFFRKHLAGWSRACLHDLRTVPQADFYAAVATFTEAFLACEHVFLALEPDEASAFEEPSATP